MLCLVAFAIASSAQTVSTAVMNVARENAAAVRLRDGRVLVTRGFGLGGYLKSAEVFDPQTGAFSAVGDTHATGCGHTATLLQNGDVLIAGGGGWLNGAYTNSSAELFVAESDTFVPVSDMLVARSNHSATLLKDGTVLFAGGLRQENAAMLADAEIYDPATRTFTRVGDMTAVRYSHGAALLPDGRVLIVGGSNVFDIGPLAFSAEIYDPETRMFERTGNTLGEHDGEAIILANGEILVLGIDAPPAIASLSEIYNPETGSFRLAPPQWSAPWAATATLLPGGNVLVAGGGDSSSTDNLSIFDPVLSTYRSVGRLRAYRTRHSAVLLRDGRVLLLAGEDGSGAAGVTPTAEIYGAPITRRRAVVH